LAPLLVFILGIFRPLVCDGEACPIARKKRGQPSGEGAGYTRRAAETQAFPAPPTA
jgi:hypothetical protein